MVQYVRLWFRNLLGCGRGVAAICWGMFVYGATICWGMVVYGTAICAVCSCMVRLFVGGYKSCRALSDRMFERYNKYP